MSASLPKVRVLGNALIVTIVCRAEIRAGMSFVLNVEVKIVTRLIVVIFVFSGLTLKCQLI